MLRRCATFLSVMLPAAMLLGDDAATARGQTPSLVTRGRWYTVDPYDVRPQPGMWPTISTAPLWQVDPFGVGYDLLSGYRPVYSGARQPIGHEIIETHNGNGYVYRPVYAPSPGYHYGWDGSLIIETPTRSVPVSAWELPAAPSAVAPQPLPPRLRGPREF